MCLSKIELNNLVKKNLALRFLGHRRAQKWVQNELTQSLHITVLISYRTLLQYNYLVDFCGWGKLWFIVFGKKRPRTSPKWLFSSFITCQCIKVVSIFIWSYSSMKTKNCLTQFWKNLILEFFSQRFHNGTRMRFSKFYKDWTMK